MAGPVQKQPEESLVGELTKAITEKNTANIHALVDKYGLDKILELYKSDKTFRDTVNKEKELDISLALNFIAALERRDQSAKNLVDEHGLEKLKKLASFKNWNSCVDAIVKGLMEEYEKTEDDKKGNKLDKLREVYGLEILDYFTTINSPFKAIWETYKQAKIKELISALAPEKKDDKWVYIKSPKRVAEIIVKEIGLDHALELYFNYENVREAWDRYYNIPLGEKGESWYQKPATWVGIDTKAEDRVDELIAAVKDYYKGTWYNPLPSGIISTSAEDVRNLQILKVYLVCGWDPERTAEWIADKVTIADINRISKNWSKTVIQSELEGGTVYYYQKDEIFKRCWEAYYRGTKQEREGNPDLFEERFEQLLSEGGDGEKIGFWAKTGDVLGKIGDVLHIIVPVGSIAHSFSPWNTESHNAAITNPTPQNMLIAIKEEQANMIDAVATIVIVLKIAKAVKAAGKAGDEAVKEALKQSAEQARRDAKDELSKTLSGDDLARAEQIVDNAVDKLAKGIETGRPVPRTAQVVPRLLRQGVDFKKLLKSVKGFDKLPEEVQDMLTDQYRSIATRLAEAKNAAALTAARESVKKGIEQKGEKTKQQLAKTLSGDDLTRAEKTVDDVVGLLKQRVDSEAFSWLRKLGGYPDRFKRSILGLKGSPRGFTRLMEGMADDFDSLPPQVQDMLIDGYIEVERSLAQSVTQAAKAAEEATVQAAKEAPKPKGLEKATKDLEDLSKKIEEFQKEIVQLEEARKAAPVEGLTADIERKAAQLKNMREALAELDKKVKILKDMESVAGVRLLRHPFVLTKRVIDEFVELAKKAAENAKGTTKLRGKLEAKVKRIDELRTREATLRREISELDEIQRKKGLTKAQQERRTAKTKEIRELREKREAGAKEVATIKKEIEAGFNVEVETRFFRQKLGELHALRERELALLDEIERMGEPLTDTARVERRAKMSELLKTRTEKFKRTIEVLRRIGIPDETAGAVRDAAISAEKALLKTGISLSVPIDMAATAVYMIPGAYELLKNFFTSHPIILDIVKNIQYYEVRAAAWAASGLVEKNVPVPTSALEERRKAVKAGEPMPPGTSGAGGTFLKAGELKTQVPTPVAKLNTEQEQWLQNNAWSVDELKKQIPANKLFETVEGIMKGNVPDNLKQFFDWKQHPLVANCKDTEAYTKDAVMGFLTRRYNNVMALLNEMQKNKDDLSKFMEDDVTRKKYDGFLK